MDGLPDHVQVPGAKLLGFGRGALAPFRGLSLLYRRKDLWGWVLVPFLLNAVLWVSGILAFLWNLGALVDWVAGRPESWYGWIAYGLAVAGVVLAGALVFVLGFTVLGNLIASPFLDVISRKVEEGLRGGPGRAGEGRPIWRTLLVELVKIGILVCAELVVLVVALAPVLGAVAAAPLQVLVGAWFLALEYVDFPLDRWGLGLRGKWAYMGARRWWGLGFGGVAVLAAMVPFLSYLMGPVFVTAATILVVEEEDSRFVPVRVGDSDGVADPGAGP